MMKIGLWVLYPKTDFSEHCTVQSKKANNRLV